ncbi:3-alpha--hydroxysteroid dehydrogenase [Sodiomyces alkalinus F11]|uniref:3-alpha--hydroxysteroid dehydrogenase n=1 Tax=Sodiomyces alkalinus (strain CBS 110278 / VKM F-3762 / F11) TaxID=1314773 RepID=A0A3N2Q173_SODAK|nr:3-alpha--hydroxysteroid dehydrogenase [Sodiomyces alkalinus F11]ROT40438.1 3-alpha--hydroxysteroid dehydrogenase [Sodiomyces alkalinus F11]
MSTNLQGKVVVVTGAGGGMGLETSKMLAARGAKVSMADVQKETLFAAAADIEKAGGQVMARVVDVTSRASVEAWINETVDKWGKLDGAANLAGILPRGFGRDTVEEVDDDDWDRVLAVNLTGTMYCMRAELRNMNEGGSVVNISSIAGLMGIPRNSSYGASKFGVIGLTKCAATEVGPTKSIRVNCIAPGTIATPMYEQVKTYRGGKPIEEIQQIKRDGRPDEIASAVCWLLCDESSYITGQVQNVCGGYIC